jgi:hypothetical protein
MGEARLARCLGILQAVVAIYETGGRSSQQKTAVPY